MKTFAGAIDRDQSGSLRLVLERKSDTNVKVRTVNHDPRSKLVTITFDPQGLSQPVAVVASIDATEKAYVADPRAGELVVGGADRFHFIAVFS